MNQTKPLLPAVPRSSSSSFFCFIADRALHAGVHEPQPELGHRGGGLRVVGSEEHLAIPRRHRCKKALTKILDRVWDGREGRIGSFLHRIEGLFHWSVGALEWRISGPIYVAGVVQFGSVFCLI